MLHFVNILKDTTIIFCAMGHSLCKNGSLSTNWGVLHLRTATKCQQALLVVSVVHTNSPQI